MKKAHSLGILQRGILGLIVLALGAALAPARCARKSRGSK